MADKKIYTHIRCANGDEFVGHSVMIAGQNECATLRDTMMVCDTEARENNTVTVHRNLGKISINTAQIVFTRRVKAPVWNDLDYTVLCSEDE